MKIMMYGLYGGMADTKCYYRKLGDCFDFVNDIKYASDLTDDEANHIIENGDWYRDCYKADGIKIVD